MLSGNNAILEHLYLNYPFNNDYFDITDFLKTYFANEDSIIEARRLKETLENLKKANYINYRDESTIPEVLEYLGYYGDEKKCVLKFRTISARLTHPGYDFIYGYLREQRQDALMEKQADSLLKANESSVITNTSLRETNDSIKKANKSQRLLTIVSLIIAGLTGFFILWSVIVAKKGVTSEEYERTDTLFQRQVQLLDSMRIIQGEIDSSLRTMAKDTFVLKGYRK